MNNIAGVLLEAGAAFSSQVPVFTPGFGWGPCCSSFSLPVLCFGLFVFVLCLAYPMLPVSLDCLFLIDPSIVSDDVLILRVSDEGYFRIVSCVLS